MSFILFLIVFPGLVALPLFFIKKDFYRKILVITSAIIIMFISLTVSVKNLNSDLQLFALNNHFIDPVIFYTELIISAILLFLSIKYRKRIVTLLIVIQTTLMSWFDLSYGNKIHTVNNLYIDKFSIVMVLIIGIIGPLICIYALGYMKDFHEKHHLEIKDNRPLFFFIFYIFLSAMFGIIFSNNLLWLYFFWEITTVSSFLLIGYNKNKESIENSFLALLFNVIGGLFFALAIIYLFLNHNTVELNQMLLLKKSIIFLPVIFLCIAGITKSAQMPFSKWLIGAMVAPTPVSALLHSSTMVKAGVYIIIKLAPLLQGTIPGMLVALIGGITFLITSFIAISQSDAKKVLAYSTIANLGLIVLCAGIGTYEATWAAILLVIFHAVAKALLFLCVGIIEHKIGSRNIEDMDGLILYLPNLGWMLLVGMAGMFLAPFGMLISKWAVLKAIIDASPSLTVVLIYGGAATLFFWVKWMGKILSVPTIVKLDDTKINKTEFSVLLALTLGTIGVCFGFPLISHFVIEPYSFSLYGRTSIMSKGNVIIMSIMMGLLIIFRFSLPDKNKKSKQIFSPTYLSGLNTKDYNTFTDSMGNDKQFSYGNYYFEEYFGEKRLFIIGAVITTLLIALLLITII